MIRALLCTVLLTLAAASTAHEIRPAYLRLQQLGEDSYDVFWRVPARENLRLAIYVSLPDNCTAPRDSLTWQSDGMLTERWSTDCAGGLTGQELRISGLEATLTDVLVRYERLDGTMQVARLTPTNTSLELTAADSWQQVARTYGVLGVEHILLGIDHLLFVLALVLIVSGWRSLVATITAFTAAHSITLALATLGLVRVPQTPVEAVIALSILFVAAEIVRSRQGKPGLTQRKPWLVAFVFGLLHGLGFAGALSEIGLPQHAIPLALLFFNVGVELGQLLFVAVILLSMRLLSVLPMPAWAWRLPVYGIGTAAAFWTIERVAQL